MFIIKVCLFLAMIVLLHGYLPTLILRLLWQRNISLGSNDYLLTFDDGPSEVTSAVIDLLNNHGQVGIFFLLGNELKQYDLSIYDQHEIACHGYQHVNFALLDPIRTIKEFQKAMTAFKEKDIHLRYFRAPYGLYNLTLLYLIKRSGLQVVQWDHLLGDWRVESEGVLYQRLKNNARDGQVIVLHDGTQGSAQPQAKWHMLKELERFLDGNP